MHPFFQHPAGRGALALGLVAGIWLSLSAFAPPVVDGTTPPAARPDRVLLAQAAEETVVEKPVTYASDQADRGQKSFVKYCVECHGEDLRGGLLGGPPLRGTSFEEKYANGVPAGVLFDFISTAMPPDSPGRYSANVYLDMMAYILKRNGYPAGAPLPSDVDALYNLTMTK
ncbi:c-type cytochrome [Devosia sp.]|uniref:c-type cytochrome n=1 Tax=Devosia sp. TaxID=1871048 RepID=UPI002EE7E994